VIAHQNGRPDERSLGRDEATKAVAVAVAFT